MRLRQVSPCFCLCSCLCTSHQPAARPLQLLGLRAGACNMMQASSGSQPLPCARQASACCFWQEAAWRQHLSLVLLQHCCQLQLDSTLSSHET